VFGSGGALEALRRLAGRDWRQKPSAGDYCVVLEPPPIPLIFCHETADPNVAGFVPAFDEAVFGRLLDKFEREYGAVREGNNCVMDPVVVLNLDGRRFSLSWDGFSVYLKMVDASNAVAFIADVDRNGTLPLLPPHDDEDAHEV